MTVSTRDVVYSYLALIEDVNEPCIPVEVILCLAQADRPEPGPAEGVDLSPLEKQAALAHLAKCGNCYAQFQRQRAVVEYPSRDCPPIETLRYLADRVGGDGPSREGAALDYRKAALEHIRDCNTCKKQYQLLRPAKPAKRLGQRLTSGLSPGGWVGAIAACLLALLIGPGLISQLQIDSSTTEAGGYSPVSDLGDELTSTTKSMGIESQSASVYLEQQTVLSGFKVGYGEALIKLTSEELTQSVETKPTILERCEYEHGEYTCAEMARKGESLGRVTAELAYECQIGGGSASVRSQFISHYHEVLMAARFEARSLCPDIEGDPCGCVDSLMRPGVWPGSLVSQ